MDGQRVNRVAVLLNGDGATVSLYRTNTKLGEVSNADLGIPNYANSNMPNKMVYMNYCRDFMINLLENGGVEGYYYEAKQSVDSDKPRKYDNKLFASGAYDMLTKTLDNMLNSSAHIKYEIMRDDMQIDVTERYKDNYIKYAKADFSISIESGNRCEVVIIPVYMKSGQLCKPKTLIHDGIDRSLTMTAINSILRGNDNPINIREAILKNIASNTLNVPVEVNGTVNTDDAEDIEEEVIEQEETI